MAPLFYRPKTRYAISMTSTSATRYVRIFVDTEFSNLTDLDLISLACVADDGTEFYAELTDYPADACNDFVRENVLPLLGQKPDAVMQRDCLKTSLMVWLERVRAERETVVVSYDYAGDWSLLVEALGETPAWLRPDNVRGRIDETIRKQFFDLTGLPEHHALFDAKALRLAYRPANG
jgi:hypothetical protein